MPTGLTLTPSDISNIMPFVINGQASFITLAMKILPAVLLFTLLMWFIRRVFSFFSVPGSSVSTGGIKTDKIDKSGYALDQQVFKNKRLS